MTETITPPAPEPPVRRLERSRDDRVIAGVCGGVAEYFRIDPVIARVAAVALVVAGGAGLLLYLAAMLLVPNAGETAPPSPRRVATIVGVVLLALAVGSLFSSNDGGWFFGPVILLGVAGIFAWQLVSGVRADRDTRSLLRAAALGAAMLIACGMLALGAGWAAATGGDTVVAVLVIGAGVALVGGAMLGRPIRWLILPSLAVALAAGFVSAVGIDARGGIGDKVFRPDSAQAIQPSYRVGVGRVALDLRGANLPPGDHVVTLKAGIGETELVVPDDVCVSTKAHMGIGGVESRGRSTGGIDVDWLDARRARPGAARVVLDGDVGIGAVRVVRSLGGDSGRPVDGACR